MNGLFVHLDVLDAVEDEEGWTLATTALSHTPGLTHEQVVYILRTAASALEAESG